MNVLLVVPIDEVRNRLRAALGDRSGLRAETYAHGLVLAEQNEVHSVVLWSAPGADAEVMDVIRGLRARAPRAPIVVITPRLTKAGVETMDVLRPRAYLLDSSTDKIVSEALAERARQRHSASPNGVPILTIAAPTSKKWGRTSKADH